MGSTYCSLEHTTYCRFVPFLALTGSLHNIFLQKNQTCSRAWPFLGYQGTVLNKAKPKLGVERWMIREAMLTLLMGRVPFLPLSAVVLDPFCCEGEPLNIYCCFRRLVHTRSSSSEAARLRNEILLCFMSYCKLFPLQDCSGRSLKWVV